MMMIAKRRFIQLIDLYHVSDWLVLANDLAANRSATTRPPNGTNFQRYNNFFTTII
jgi:hypothetical protein